MVVWRLSTNIPHLSSQTYFHGDDLYVIRGAGKVCGQWIAMMSLLIPAERKLPPCGFVADGRHKCRVAICNKYSISMSIGQLGHAPVKTSSPTSPHQQAE